ncbi:MAG: hypothetical protein E6I61_00900 [Chloroflexi bacterium]|nr:MAG: hypothetical protein E6J08_05315 [Chloroflexota bacterium]TME05030.1 MAG: hypothetical protein E6I71_04035 [Chloroflexota bacterium]TME42922.1 MAG: hypothetical protein E6I61_00900 [Chloroflexota bacterium]TME52495.1 MAG: hypothetical protein E6I53_06025 [Chloroflexota bacterium]
MQARFDKAGRRLPDTGYGCGCQLCADSNAPRYERREDPGRESRVWSPLRRRLIGMFRSEAAG